MANIEVKSPRLPLRCGVSIGVVGAICNRDVDLSKVVMKYLPYPSGSDLRRGVPGAILPVIVYDFYEAVIIDGLVKSNSAVIPAEAGIQKLLILLDPGLRRGDDIRRFRTFYEIIIIDGTVKRTMRALSASVSVSGSKRSPVNF